MRLSRTRQAAVALAIGMLAGAVPARAQSLEAEYGIWLAGLPLGSAHVRSTLEGGRYRLDLDARLTGLAGLVTGGGATASASGSVTSARPIPASYAVTSSGSGESRTVRMGLAGGNVAALDVAPPIDWKPDRVPLGDIHKRGVVDPLSAVLMPALARGPLTDPGNCNRTLPVFDGAARFNVVLSYAGTRRVEKPGYSGPVLVCNARYVPLAGHRAEKPATKFMQENRDISVWLAPVEPARLLVPLRISIRTMIGTTVIEARRWSAEGAGLVPVSSRSRRS